MLERGVPGGNRKRSAGARCLLEPAVTPAGRGVMAAGFALPRDAGPHRKNWPEVGVPSRPLDVRYKSLITHDITRVHKVSISRCVSPTRFAVRRCKVPPDCRAQVSSPCASAHRVSPLALALRLLTSAVLIYVAELPRQSAGRRSKASIVRWMASSHSPARLSGTANLGESPFATTRQFHFSFSSDVSTSPSGISAATSFR